MFPPEDHPVTPVLRRIGDRWSMVVVCLLHQRPHRYNELRWEITGISQRMLTYTVRGLEDEGYVERTVFPTVPPGVEYALTDRGRDLVNSMLPLLRWANNAP